MTDLERLISEIKQRHHLTDAEIAATLGVSERTLHRWQSRKAGYPGRRKRQALLGMLLAGDAVRKTLDDLFDRLRALGEARGVE